MTTKEMGKDMFGFLNGQPEQKNLIELKNEVAERYELMPEMAELAISAFYFFEAADRFVKSQK